MTPEFQKKLQREVGRIVSALKTANGEQAAELEAELASIQRQLKGRADSMRGRTAFTDPPPRAGDDLEVAGKSFRITRVWRWPGRRKGTVWARGDRQGDQLMDVEVPLETLRQYGANNHYWLA